VYPLVSFLFSDRIIAERGKYMAEEDEMLCSNCGRRPLRVIPARRHGDKIFCDGYCLNSWKKLHETPETAKSKGESVPATATT
jgi:hypothetical protein